MVKNFTKKLTYIIRWKNALRISNHGKAAKWPLSNLFISSLSPPRGHDLHVRLILWLGNFLLILLFSIIKIQLLGKKIFII